MSITSYNLTEEQARSVPHFYYPEENLDDFKDAGILELLARRGDRTRPKIVFDVRPILGSFLQLIVHPIQPIIQNVCIGVQDDKKDDQLRRTVSRILGFPLTEDMRMQGRTLRDFLPDNAAGLTFKSGTRYNGKYVFQDITCQNPMRVDRDTLPACMNVMWTAASNGDTLELPPHLDDTYESGFSHEHYGPRQIITNARFFQEDAREIAKVERLLGAVQEHKARRTYSGPCPDAD